MNIDEGRILALNGAMLAEGSFEFEGEEAATLTCPPDALVAVRPIDGIGTEISLVGNARKDAAGFWSADWQIHALTFQRNMPTLRGLLDSPGFSKDGRSVRLQFECEDGGLAWAALGTVYPRPPEGHSVLGYAGSVAVEVERTADGLRFAIQASSDLLKRGDTPAPALTIRISFFLTLSTLALGGRLWAADHRIIDLTGDSPPAGPLGRVLTLHENGGLPYFEGVLDLGPNQPDDFRGSWIFARLFATGLQLTPERPPRRMSSGFYKSFSNDGPDLLLRNVGLESWKEMLGNAKEADLVQSGSGIGYLQGVTGPSAGEIGPHIQPVRLLRTQLRLRDDGLKVWLSGEVGEIEQQEPRRPPLGPEFSVDFLVPTAFFFARGMAFGDMYRERKQKLQDGETP